MTRIQTYLFYEVFRTVVIIVGGLALLALLAQGLSQTDLIIENRQSAFTYFYVVMLGAPQVISLLTPLALFIASVWSLNRIHKDSEIVVAQAAGMSRWQVASPIIRLAVFAAVAHLVINLWVQPTAQRVLRENVADIRADLVATVVQPGQFRQADDQLTVYARESRGGELYGMLISDARDPREATDILAQTGTVVEIDGKPAIILRDGQFQTVDENGSLSILDFEQHAFDLTPFMQEDSNVVLKGSDRYLYELFFIDTKDYLEVRNELSFKAEAHARLTLPLINITMALLAVVAVIGGDFSRRGYGRRISIATTVALVLVVVQISLPSAAADDAALNAVQWAVPLISIAVLCWMAFVKGKSKSTGRGRRFLLRDRIDGAESPA
ncbi:MAG: LptF/LptG family permease [Pseudomonadota bacterium]